MKTLILSLLVLSSASAYASNNEPTYKLGQGAEELRPIAGKVTQISMLCPEGHTCITNGTVIDLNFRVSCVNSVTPVEYQAVEMRNELHVFASALEITDESASRVRCAKPNDVKQQIVLFNKYGTVKMHFLGVLDRQ